MTASSVSAGKKNLASRDSRCKAIYLDNNATTRVLPEVREAMVDTLDGGFGNASSAHSLGETARQRLFQARQAVADLVGAEPEQVFFTSGATEANNLVLQSTLAWDAPGGLLTTSIEHSSILKCGEWLEWQGLSVDHIRPNPNGWIEPAALEAHIAECRPRLVAVHWVNNETGVVQPIAEISEICRSFNIPLLSDGAQAIGKVPVDFSTSGLDFLTLSAHKFHGPPGVGALVVNDASLIRPLVYGGDQEMGLRAGTENLPGIVGLGVAARLRKERRKDIACSLTSLRDRFEAALSERFAFVRVNGDTTRRVCNTTNLCFEGLDGQALTARFDADGVQCSQSSACTNARPEPSYVLRAMGLSEADAYASIRFAFSELNVESDVDEAVVRISTSVERLAAVMV